MQSATIDATPPDHRDAATTNMRLPKATPPEGHTLCVHAPQYLATSSSGYESVLTTPCTTSSSGYESVLTTSTTGTACTDVPPQDSTAHHDALAEYQCAIT